MEGIIVTPLTIISHPKGDILHGMKKSDQGFSEYGEAYFSTLKFGEIKGWNKHERMVLNLIVPIGKVTFVIYDKKLNNYFEITISPENYQRLTVSPGLWLAFKGRDESFNLILNIASIEHDQSEIKKLDIEKIPYKWD